MLAPVFTQDAFNPPQAQRGLASAQYDEAVLARYQEAKIRHCHTLLADFIKARAVTHSCERVMEAGAVAWRHANA